MVTRRHAAILAADMVGFSRLMEEDEEGTFARVQALRSTIIEPCLDVHRGRLFKTMGDGFLVEFGCPLAAVRAALDIQDRLAASEAVRPPPNRTRLRIGVNAGDVIIDGDDVYGEGVNIAARLEQRSEPGGIWMTDAVYGSIAGKTDRHFENRGEQRFKNITRAIIVYAFAEACAPHLPPDDLDLARRPMLVVLPFTERSGHPEQAFFAQGLTEDIVAGLSRAKALLVIHPNSASQYADRSDDFAAVSQQLGARYILHGSVRWSGTRLRTAVKLIDAHQGIHLWAERFDHDREAIFDVQDEITKHVVASIQTQLNIHEGQLVRNAERLDLEIWELAKRSLAEIHGLSRASLQRSRALAHTIVERRPDIAKGHQLLAMAATHIVLMGYADDREAMIAEAVREAGIAIGHDAGDEYTLWTLALINGNVLGNLELSLALYRQILAGNPNFWLALASLSSTLAFAGQAEEAIAKTHLAIRTNPRDPSLFARYSSLAVAHYHREDLAEARKWAEISSTIKPDWWLAQAMLAASLSDEGNLSAAEQAVTALKRACPGAGVGRLPFEPVRVPCVRTRFEAALARAGL